MQLDPGTIIAGRFRLERQLSSGGMGSVWVARHTQLGHQVAIKFMDPKFAVSPTFRARFEREARAAANLRSPHVVRVEDSGIEDGTPWLVMELLEGEDFAARLRRCGRISLPEAARILGQAGKAIRRAHDAGLVHRDLKPGNLFLARVEDEEVVKVLDFGIAKESGGKLAGAATQTGEVLGSPFYMSPEQVRGDKELDRRSDLWSFGVILFRAVTGQLPFGGDQLGTVMAKILVDPIPIATQIAPDLPAGIDAFFEKAFERDRAHRFQSVREMLEELSRIAGTPRAPLGSFNDAGASPSLTAPAAAVVVPTAPLPPSNAPDDKTLPLPGSAHNQPATPPVAQDASSGAGPSGTLTTGGITGREQAPRSKAAWLVAAGGAAILVIVVVVITVARLGGTPEMEPAAAGPEAEPAVDAAQAAQTAETPADTPIVEPVEPAPVIEAPAPAEPEASTAAPAAPPPARAATASTTRKQPTASTAKRSTSPQTTPRPTHSTPSKPPKHPDWGME